MKICPSLLSCTYVHQQSPEKQAIRINEVNFQDEGYDDLSTPRSTVCKSVENFEKNSFTENLPASEVEIEENGLNSASLLSKINENQNRIKTSTDSITKLKRENSNLKRQLNKHRKIIYRMVFLRINNMFDFRSENASFDQKILVGP